MIVNSFKSCTLNLKSDGSEDELIHCFKKIQPCACGSDVLKEQFQLLRNADELNENRFAPSDSDVEEANNEENLIDVDEDYYVNIEDL